MRRCKKMIHFDSWHSLFSTNVEISVFGPTVSRSCGVLLILHKINTTNISLLSSSLVLEKQYRNCANSWRGGDEWYLEAILALWSSESVSVLCRAPRRCYGYIFEEEICDTHMVISSRLAKSLKDWNAYQSAGVPPPPPTTHTHTHWRRIVHKQTHKYTQSTEPFRSPTVQFLQPIHLHQLSVYCQGAFENTHTHTHTRTGLNAPPSIKTQTCTTIWSTQNHTLPERMCVFEAFF